MKMYDTKSSNNVINKVLENEHEFDIKFKDKTDIVNPVVILHSSTLILSNYTYIPDFHRYYFVDKIELFPNSVYNITLRCDVLESFKDDILASSGFINQQSQNVNKYYNSNYQSEVRKEVDLYKSNVTIPIDVKSTILVTIGGV
jgi:hypothetical protein